MNDMTSMFSTSKMSQHTQQTNRVLQKNNETKNVLNINVNSQNTTISKNIWNIPVYGTVVEMPLEDSTSNVTQPSDINTLERVNDLDFVESKLNSLRSQLETSL